MLVAGAVVSAAALVASVSAGVDWFDPGSAAAAIVPILPRPSSAPELATTSVQSHPIPS